MIKKNFPENYCYIKNGNIDQNNLFKNVLDSQNCPGKMFPFVI